jgi:hypothetical protein
VDRPQTIAGPTSFRSWRRTVQILNWLFGKKKRQELAPEDENLRRWRESGQARAWVEARQGQWGHEDWLALLEALKQSEFWPLDPDAVGLALEDAKREWLQRN